MNLNEYLIFTYSVLVSYAYTTTVRGWVEDNGTAPPRRGLRPFELA